MQIDSLGTICIKCQILFSRKNKKKIWKCLLKYLSSMQSVKLSLFRVNVVGVVIHWLVTCRLCRSYTLRREHNKLLNTLLDFYKHMMSWSGRRCSDFTWTLISDHSLSTSTRIYCEIMFSMGMNFPFCQK